MNPIPLKNYDLSYGPAQKIIKKRLARNGCNFSSDEVIISPADIFNSKYLIDIISEVEDKNLRMNLKDSVSPVLIEDVSDKNLNEYVPNQSVEFWRCWSRI